MAAGCAASQYLDVNCESAIYVSKGKVGFLNGPTLETILEIEAGDFLYVPQNLMPQPINYSSTEPMELLVARDTAVEIVEGYNPNSAG